MENQFDKREIIIPIATKGEKEDGSKTTTNEAFFFNQIYAVSTQLGDNTGTRGLLLYIVGHTEAIEAIRDFSYKKWWREINSVDEQTGKKRYSQVFKEIGPKLTVNFELLSNENLDRKNRKLCFPSFLKPEFTFDLTPKQFAELTQIVAKKDNKLFSYTQSILSSLSSMVKVQHRERIAAKENADMTYGCLFLTFLLLLLNTGLLIAILCIVV